MMNVGVMALTTLLIFAEKSTPVGRQSAGFAALGLIAYGALVVFMPDLLPTMTMGSSPDGGMPSMAG